MGGDSLNPTELAKSFPEEIPVEELKGMNYWRSVGDSASMYEEFLDYASRLVASRTGNIMVERPDMSIYPQKMVSRMLRLQEAIALIGVEALLQEPSLPHDTRLYDGKITKGMSIMHVWEAIKELGGYYKTFQKLYKLCFDEDISVRDIQIDPIFRAGRAVLRYGFEAASTHGRPGIMR